MRVKLTAPVRTMSRLFGAPARQRRTLEAKAGILARCNRETFPLQLGTSRARAAGDRGRATIDARGPGDSNIDAVSMPGERPGPCRVR